MTQPDSIAINLTSIIVYPTTGFLSDMPKTPNEKALDVLAKELESRGYKVLLKMGKGQAPYLLINHKLKVNLKWIIDPYQPNEHPDSYEEKDYYFDEMCLEISVDGLMVESTMCYQNFLAKMREIKTLNPNNF